MSRAFSVPPITNLQRNKLVPYRLEGTIGVDAGRLGQPVFGPMTLIRGETSAR